MQKQIAFFLVTLLISATAVSQQPRVKGVLIVVRDTATGKKGYRNKAGKIVIPLGKYTDCTTDRFRDYAIVGIQGKGFFAIDRQERILYEVFFFDNGPDYASDGLFRIVEDGKIGYAYKSSGKIAIKPQFPCAWPFEHGVAKVALDCQDRAIGEYHAWDSDKWFYINKAGITVTLSEKQSAAYEEALGQFGH
jgi:hypothetical protein